MTGFPSCSVSAYWAVQPSGNATIHSCNIPVPGGCLHSMRFVRSSSGSLLPTTGAYRLRAVIARVRPHTYSNDDSTLFDAQPEKVFS